MACATAQDSSSDRDRELLRRTQAALRAAQADNQQLRADVVRLQRETESKGTRAAESEQRATAESQRLRALQANKLELESQAEAMRLQAGQQQQALEKAERALAQTRARSADIEQQLAAAQASLRDQVQTVAALSQLLEQSTQALSAAKASNLELFKAGMAIVDAYAARTATEQAALDEPLLGLARVRLQDRAEALRARLAALRLPG